jgi:hypothetical protein
VRQEEQEDREADLGIRRAGHEELHGIAVQWSGQLIIMLSYDKLLRLLSLISIVLEFSSFSLIFGKIRHEQWNKAFQRSKFAVANKLSVHFFHGNALSEHSNRTEFFVAFY